VAENNDVIGLFCACAAWEPNIKHVNDPIILQSARSGGSYQYKGQPFVFCPWCGERLKELRQKPV